MRRFDATPRRATPKGHKTFISCTATHQRAVSLQTTPFRARGAPSPIIWAGAGIDPPRSEPTLSRVVLLARDCWLVADDEIALDYRPLAPAFECHLKTVAERTRHRFRASAVRSAHNIGRA